MNKLRVLWLEDEPTIVGLLRDLFRDWQIPWLVLSIVEDGDEALSLVRRTKPDVLFTDGSHPGLSGKELALAVKQDPELCHILTVMTYPESGPPKPPFDYYLAKDCFDVPALRTLLDALRADCQDASDDPPWRVLQRREQASVYGR